MNLKIKFIICNYKIYLIYIKCIYELYFLVNNIKFQSSQ